MFQRQGARVWGWLVEIKNDFRSCLQGYSAAVLLCIAHEPCSNLLATVPLQIAVLSLCACFFRDCLFLQWLAFLLHPRSLHHRHLSPPSSALSEGLLCTKFESVLVALLRSSKWQSTSRLPHWRSAGSGSGLLIRRHRLFQRT